jgi:membrane-bound lytic murein transglycosylase B
MVPAQYQALIDRAAAQYGVPADHLARMLRRESGFRPEVIDGRVNSSAGAQGIAQFMPGTAKELGVDPLNPESAIPGAAQYLAQLQKQFGGNLEHATAAYNYGPGNVQKWLAGGGDPSRLPAETQAYLKAVMQAGAPATPQATAGVMPAFGWSPSPATTPAAQASAAPKAASSGLLGALPAAGGNSMAGILGMMGGQPQQMQAPPLPEPYRPRVTYQRRSYA